MRRYFNKGVLFSEPEAVDILKHKAYNLHTVGNLEPLIHRIGDARIVMLGEASHGTHEYYTWRTYITKRLIAEKGFNFIAVEGDWPDCYRLNRYIKGADRDHKGAFQVLHAFNRWPTWMWANWEIVALAEWLKEHNKNKPAGKKAGFYGLDVYSLWESMEAIMGYLEKTDPDALKVAKEAYSCFEPYRNEEGHGYARALQMVPELCENEVVNLLREIRHRLPQYNTDHENVFSAEQNALITVHAEEYYRAMIQGGPHSWNVRDRHMAQTLNRLLEYHGNDAKVIVWAHNTHVGDARATDMAHEGMFNIGELARVHEHEKGVVLVGFGSYSGTVMAGRRWGAPMTTMEVPAARQGSWEYLLHRAGAGNKLLLTEDLAAYDLFMEQHIGHRAIGVVYNPELEKYGNYVPTVVPLRYDAFIFLDQTRALHPLHLEPDGEQMPLTFPFGD